MLDEREGEVADDELDKAFNRKPLGSRVAIVAAGPIANLLFAVFAYWFIFVMGIPGIRSLIDDVTPNSPAATAQIMPGDEIIAINGNKTPTWSSVYRELSKRAQSGGPANITVNTGGIIIERTMDIPKVDLSTPISSSIFEQIGLSPIRVELIPVVATVVKGGAAANARLLDGDLIVAVDGQAIEYWNQFVDVVQKSANKPLNVTVKRGSKSEVLIMTPNEKGKIGVMVDAKQTSIPSQLKAKEQYGWGQAIVRACYETWSFSSSTIKSLVGMLTGSVSSKNIGGPITIAQFAGDSADRGLISFISFLAMISISLGILNLLPIPVLDGGHLALYFVEWIRGAPLSEQVQVQGQKIGVIVLLMLMFLAFFNDLTRLFG